jgi:AraC family transcriptional activator of pobA
MAARKHGTELVEFLRTKYGAEILIDVAWVHDMPTFMHKGPHRLGFYDVLLVTRGEGRYVLDGYVHAVRPGTVLFTAPHQLRQWDVRNLDGLCLFFLPSFVSQFLSDTEFLSRLPYFNCRADTAALQLHPRASALLRRRLLEMQREFAGLRADSADVLRAGLYKILIQLARDFASEHPRARLRPANRTTAAFQALVAARVQRAHRVAVFAAQLKVSANHLNAMCQRHLGQSAKAVIAEALVLEARRALTIRGRSVEAVGASLGFKDPSYFARFFKRMTGQSPTSFRDGQRLELASTRRSRQAVPAYS